MMSIPITLKWGKTVHIDKISVQPGSPAQALKQKIQDITNVPPSRQKLLCPKYWKGALKDTDHLPDFIPILKERNTFVVTLIGSTETLVEKPIEERPHFIEDSTPDEVKKAGRIDERRDGDEIDIVALQREPGRDRDDGKMEMYQYNRLVTGLPQHQIRDRLAIRKRKPSYGDAQSEEAKSFQLSDEVAMNMGLELRRAYVNSLTVLNDGTLVSGLDDGHVQIWRRGELVKDVVHRSGGVDHVLTFPSFGSDGNVEGPVFVTGGSGSIGIWAEGGDYLLSLSSPPGTTPASLAAGSIVNTTSGNKVAYLASCFRVTRPINPNQFRPMPQNEAERLRREAAEVQEQMIQQDLARTSRLMRVWFYDGSTRGGNSIGFNSNLIEGSAPVTKLTDLNGRLVCGDEWGGIRIIEWREGNVATNGKMEQHDYANFQFRCAGYHCPISFMEPIKHNLLAVSIYAEQNFMTGVSGVIPSASPLHITNARGVFIVDVEKAIVRAVLDGHSDVVTCICPLPDGSILTAGGKMDATVRVWESSTIAAVLQEDRDDQQSPPVLTDANKLKHPGYVFDLKVLPDSEPDSNVYAVAGARYNLITIII